MTISKKVIVIACLTFVAGLFASPVFAADDDKKVQDIKGTVSVTKDANDQVTDIVLTSTSNSIYHIKLDEKGKELAKYEGEEVEVHGKVTIKNDQQWLEVKHTSKCEKEK